MRAFFLTIATIVGMLQAITGAVADWREDIGVFRIGIVAKEDLTGTLARIEPFRLAITEALEMDVEFFPASNSRSVIEALVAERIEYAILSTSGYSLASVQCQCIEPLVVPRSTDSTDGYHLVGIMLADQAFDASNLVNMKVGMLSRSSVLGETFVDYLLNREYPELSSGSVDFQSVDSSEQTLSRFLNGDYDILFGWSSMTGDPKDGYTRGTLRKIVQSQENTAFKYRLVWKSRQIPHRPHVLRKKLPGEAKTRLRDTLVNLFERDPVAYDSIEPIYGGGFTAARNDRFREVTSFFETYKSDSSAISETTSGEQTQ